MDASIVEGGPSSIALQSVEMPEHTGLISIWMFLCGSNVLKLTLYQCCGLSRSKDTVDMGW